MIKIELLTITMVWPSGWKVWSKNFWKWFPTTGVICIDILHLDLVDMDLSLLSLGYWYGRFQWDLLFLYTPLYALFRR